MKRRAVPTRPGARIRAGLLRSPEAAAARCEPGSGRFSSKTSSLFPWDNEQPRGETEAF